MIKINLFEPDIHRNETTFRPYMLAYRELREIGIELCRNNSSCDFHMVGQASIINKSISLDESIRYGNSKIQKIGTDVIVVDGQDSPSLKGVVEVVAANTEKVWLFLKDSLLKNFDSYLTGYTCGRSYWGTTDDVYIPPKNIPTINLSGKNWLSTITNNNIQYIGNQFKKYNDVSALFNYPAISGNEYGVDHYVYYNMHRANCINQLNKLSHRNIVKLKDGVKLPYVKYREYMQGCKIIIAPFGYGEIAPRDLEAAAFGSVLIKPKMDHIDTVPNIYIDGETYIACEHDFSDLNEKIEMVLGNYAYYRNTIPYNFIKKFNEEYTGEKLAVYLHQLFLSAGDKITI